MVDLKRSDTNGDRDLKVLISACKIQDSDRHVESAQTVIPCLDKLESSGLTADQYQCVSLLQRRLSDIVSPFLRAAALLSIHLTQKEAQVADLIRQGKKTLEIASLLGCSKRAVEFHRDSLRKKLKIKNRKAILRQVLLKIGPCSEYV